MEGSQLPPREADVTPAPTVDPTQTHGGGWTPANPAPLGLAGFALTTFVLSMVNSNLVGGGAEPVVFGLAFAYGGIAQLLAGMWEFRTGNTFGAVAFSSYGAFWISFFILTQLDVAKISPTEVDAGLGLYLWAWAIFTAIMTVAALRTTGAVLLVFVLLTLTFIFLGIGNAGGHVGSIHIGGYLGLATAVAAWYAAMAAVVNSTFGRDVMPTIPLGA